MFPEMEEKNQREFESIRVSEAQLEVPDPGTMPILLWTTPNVP
jgi:hypothetical protein